MYKREMVESYLDSKRYQSALSISRGHKIYGIHAEKGVVKGNTCVQLMAQVFGSGRKVYGIEVIVDLDTDKIIFGECSCPDFSKTGKMCKHMGAVLIKAIDEIDFNDELIEIETTPDFLGLLKEYEKESALIEIETVEDSDMVKLEPIIVDNIKMEELSVSFKIGREKMYVVKDAMKLIYDIQNKNRVIYGKDLEFIHRVEIFDEASREWLDLITTWREELIHTHSQSPYRPYIGSRKEITVYGETMDKVIELCSRDGLITWKNLDENKVANYKLIQEAPRYEMSITKGEDGAIIKYQIPEFHIGREYLLFNNEKIKYYDKRENWSSVESLLLYLSTEAPDEIYLSEKDYSLFAEELLPQLQDKFDVTLVDFEPSQYVKEKPKFEFHIIHRKENDELICSTKILYENQEYTMLARDGDISHRNLKDEIKIKRLIRKHFENMRSEIYWMYDTDDNILNLLRYGLEELSNYGEVHIDETLLKARSKFTPSVELGVGMKGNLLDISITSEDLSFKEIQEILSKYDTKKNYYRLKSGEFIDMTSGAMESLIKLNSHNKMDISKLKSGHIVLPSFRALYLDEALKEYRENITSVRDKSFKSLINNIKTVEDNDYEVPSSIIANLRPYQVLGFKWIKTMKNNGFGCILADDMGLGKTLQVITFLQSEKEAQPDEMRDSLVICPASLIYNWESEIKKFAPNLSVEVVVGNQEDRLGIIQKEGRARVLVTSYDLLRRDIETYKEKDFATQIIDEAQYIKNHNAQMTKAVKLIQSDFTVAMTGTPVENRLSELWSIFDYLMPGFLYNYNQFRKEIELAIINSDSKEAMVRLQKMVHPFILRRIKGEVLKDLPEKVEKVSATKMSGEQKKLYDAHALRLKKVLEKQSEEEFKQGKIEILAELTKLRQLCCHPSLLYGDYQEESAKLDLCMEYVRQAVEGGHKVLLFSQFTSMLEIITEKLKSENISFYKLTGSTSKEKRRDLVDAFNNDDTSIFCISLKAGGTGLNLTSADMVIHFDPWWNAAAENQATDRAHRMGQKNTVNVYKLVLEGTIEEKIVKLQSKKLELANQILSGENISTGAFTKGELLDILEV